MRLPEDDELQAFREAGPVRAEVDLDRLMAAAVRIGGEYTLIAGDLIKLQIPAMLQPADRDRLYGMGEEYRTHLCRVFDDGTILVPVVGRVSAAGHTLGEVEEAIINGFYPRYTNTPPSIVASLAAPRRFRVSITGAVQKPGVYELPHDQMSLVSLIMRAEGFAEDGAAVILVSEPATGSAAPNPPTGLQLFYTPGLYGEDGRISVRDGDREVFSERVDVADRIGRRQFVQRLAGSVSDLDREAVLRRLEELSDVLDRAAVESPGRASQEGAGNPSENAGAGGWRRFGAGPLVLPVKGTNIPFADVALQEGTRVEVRPLPPEFFTVIGLVQKPGAYPYPPEARFNLMQALAFAGGVNPVADPRYVRVYRQTEDGRIVDAAFPLQGKSPAGAPAITVKPGDVIAVEQTARTHWNLLLSEILYLRAGAGLNYLYYEGSDLRNPD